MIPAIDNSHLSRQTKLCRLLIDHGLDTLILVPGPNMVYFTGLHFHLSERPIMAVFTKNEPTTFILPELEQGKLDEIGGEYRAFPYGEDPDKWPKVFNMGLKQSLGRKENPTFGIEPRMMRFLEINLIQSLIPGVIFQSSDELITSLRIIKDPLEVEDMRHSAKIAITAFNNTLPFIKIGVSEREIASELSFQLLKAGSDPSFPFSPIVSGGLNSANPHAVPTDRSLQSGDMLVIDWGATYNGYISDITRTLAVEAIDSKFSDIYSTVKGANKLGRDIVAPGVSADDIDNAARSYIKEHGYGQYFIHRTGHGLGLEGHEAPYIRQGNQFVMSPGMTFTVEPGIYIPGHGGVRIEDDVLVTETGSEIITPLSRELIVTG